MTDKPITYARAGGPPSIWRRLKVYDGEQQLMRCKEVNTVEGWAIVLVDKVDGKTQLDPATGEMLTQKIESTNLRIEMVEDVGF